MLIIIILLSINVHIFFDVAHYIPHLHPQYSLSSFSPSLHFLPSLISFTISHTPLFWSYPTKNDDLVEKRNPSWNPFEKKNPPKPRWKKPKFQSKLKKKKLKKICKDKHWKEKKFIKTIKTYHLHTFSTLYKTHHFLKGWCVNLKAEEKKMRFYLLYLVFSPW